MPAIILHLIFGCAAPGLFIFVAGGDDFGFADLVERGPEIGRIGKLLLYGVFGAGAAYGVARVLIRHDSQGHQIEGSIKKLPPPETAEDEKAESETEIQAMFEVNCEPRMPVEEMRIVRVSASKNKELIQKLSAEPDEEVTRGVFWVTPSVRVDAYGEGFEVNLRGDPVCLIPDVATTEWIFEIVAKKPGKRVLTVRIQMLREMADGKFIASDVENQEIPIVVYVGWWGAVQALIISHRGKIAITVLLMLIALIAAMLGFLEEVCRVLPDIPIFCRDDG